MNEQQNDPAVLTPSIALDAPIDAALADYFVRIDQGAHVEPSDIIAAHPSCESALRKFFDHEQKLHAVTAASLVAEMPGKQAGQTLGDFRILRELGRGGMGVVYEAEQLSLRRRVALKVLPFAAMLDTKQLARFKNEARAAATLDHPHIVAVHSVGTDQDIHYYAMQLIEGQSLAEVIAALRRAQSPSLPVADTSRDDAMLSTDNAERSTDFSRPAHVDAPPLPTLASNTAAVAPLHTTDPQLPPFGSREYYRSIARLGIQAADALQHAHDLGVLHRDIKPGNLMLECSHLAPRDDSSRLAERDGYTLYITDFGLARIEADAGLTMTGDFIGTLRYMPPEQALAKRVVIDHRADVYSLGATLYELLTLQPAFGETDRAALLKQIAFEEPRALRKIDRRIPADLETIALKAMEKNPEERFETVEQLAADLRAYLEDKPIKAKPSGLAKRVVKWSRRHQSAVFATTAILLFVSIGLAVGAGLIWGERKRTDEAFTWAVSSLVDADTTSDAARAKIYQEVLARNRALGLAEHESTMKVSIRAVEQYLALEMIDQTKLELAEWSKLSSDVRKSNAPILFAVMTKQSSQFENNGNRDVPALIDEFIVQESKELFPGNSVIVTSMNELAHSRFIAGRLDEAKSVQEEALKMLQTNNDFPFLLHDSALNNLGDIYREQREFDAEESIRTRRVSDLKQAMATNKDTVTEARLADSLKDLALILQEKGKYDESLELLLEARGVITGGDTFSKACVDLQLGCLLIDLNDFDVGQYLLMSYHPYILDVVRRKPGVKALLDYAVRMKLSLSIAASHRNDLEKALTHYQSALNLIANPQIAEVFELLKHYQPVPYQELRERAAALLGRLESGDIVAAETEPVSQTVTPGLLDIRNHLAWQFATSGDSSERDGKRALLLATQVCKLTEFKNPICIATLAAAYAESGEFENALDWQKAAIQLLRPSDKPRLEEYSLRLTCYQEGKPWRVGSVSREQFALFAAYDRRWQDAATEYSKIIEVAKNSGTNELDFLRYSAVLARLNDRSALNAMREAALSRYAQTVTPRSAERIVRACLLVGADSTYLAKLESMRDLLSASQSQSTTTKTQKMWNSLAIALFDYRRGEWESSIASCELGKRYVSDTIHSALLLPLFALNHHRLGQLDRAREVLRQVDELIETNYVADKRKADSWFDWEFASILRDEARELIERRPAM